MTTSGGSDPSRPILSGPSFVLPPTRRSIAGRRPPEGGHAHRWYHVPPAPRTLDQDAAEFVRFCYRRRRVGWPELYDEMCAVRPRAVPRDECRRPGGSRDRVQPLRHAGPGGAGEHVVAEEHAKRRPVAVAIIAEDAPLLIETATAADEAEIAARGTASFEHVVRGDRRGQQPSRPT